MITKIGSPPTTLPLIAPKSFRDYSPEEYHSYVSSFYELRAKGGKPKKAAVAAGLRVRLTKTGKVSVARVKSLRAFAYVLNAEIEALAREAGLPISEVWNEFRAKKFIIAATRMEAEEIYADINAIPW